MYTAYHRHSTVPNTEQHDGLIANWNACMMERITASLLHVVVLRSEAAAPNSISVDTEVNTVGSAASVAVAGGAVAVDGQYPTRFVEPEVSDRCSEKSGVFIDCWLECRVASRFARKEIVKRSANTLPSPARASPRFKRLWMRKKSKSSPSTILRRKYSRCSSRLRMSTMR